MLKVLHLIKALGRGGAEVLLTEGLAVADRQRFEYSYGYLQTCPNDVAEDLRVQGVRVDCFHMNSNLSILLGAPRISRFMIDQGIDLVHAHLPMAGVAARIAAKLAKVPVVYTVHSPPDRNKWPVRYLGLLTWRWQDQVIAISEDVKKSTLGYSGSTVPVETVWNGVNTADFRPSMTQRHSIRTELKIAPASPVVGTVAGLRPVKRIDVWLDAARIVYDQYPDTQFLIVGDGALQGGLKRHAAALGLANNVHFVGSHRDVRPYLSAMDIFMISSHFEGFGIAPVEAMAMGIPVVATDVEGLQNIIQPGVTGLLGAFDYNVANNLAALVIELIESPEKRKKLSSAGQKVATERFGIDRMQSELEAIYDRVIMDSRRS